MHGRQGIRDRFTMCRHSGHRQCILSAKDASGSHMLFSASPNQPSERHLSASVLHKYPSNTTKFLLFMHENVRPPPEQRLFRSGRLLVRLANNACAARPDCLCGSPECAARAENSAFRTKSERFHSILTVNISLLV